MTYLANLFSNESCFNECSLVVLVRKRSYGYGDEQNYQDVPSEQIAVGKDF